MRSRALLPVLAAVVLATNGPAFAQRDTSDGGRVSAPFSLPSPIGPEQSGHLKAVSPWEESVPEHDNPWADRNLRPDELPYGRIRGVDEIVPPEIGTVPSPLSPTFPNPGGRGTATLDQNPVAQPLPSLNPEPTNVNPFRPQLPTIGTSPTSALPPPAANPFRPAAPSAAASQTGQASPARANPYPLSTTYGPFVPGPAMGPFTPTTPPATASAAPSPTPYRLTGPYATAQAGATGAGASASGAAPASRSPGIDAWYAEPQNRTAVDRLRQQFNSQRGTLHPGYYGVRNNPYGGGY